MCELDSDKTRTPVSVETRQKPVRKTSERFIGVNYFASSTCVHRGDGRGVTVTHTDSLTNLSPRGVTRTLVSTIAMNERSETNFTPAFCIRCPQLFWWTLSGDDRRRLEIMRYKFLKGFE